MLLAVVFEAKLELLACLPHIWLSVCVAVQDADDARNEKDESGKMQLMLLKDVSGAFRPGVGTSIICSTDCRSSCCSAVLA